jgi:hypothetical protein
MDYASNVALIELGNVTFRYGHTYRATLSLVRSDTVKPVRAIFSSAVGDDARTDGTVCGYCQYGRFEEVE